tara:strand:- start:2148 stop:2789 length:642 start_codon:yes stop_codon:yes gene_type:complete
MIYSKTNNFLFIHIPKTAGTSIRQVLEPYGGKPGLKNFLARRNQNLIPVINKIFNLNAFRTYDAHTTYEDVLKILGEKELNSLYKFAFVRNPYSRLYSFYLHILAHPEHPWYSKIKNYGSFKTMLHNLEDVNEPTQKSYVTDKNGKIVVDFIGHLENIDEDFKKICKEINVPYNLPRANARKHKAWQEVYDEEDLNLAYKYYKEDFDAFGYKK